MKAAIYAEDDKWPGDAWLDPDSPSLLIVLVLAGVKSNFFTVACMGLYCGFVLKTVLITGMF